MRDTKSLLLLLVSLMLVLVSFGLLWTWGYRFNDKTAEVRTEPKVLSLDSVAIANNIRDSLQKVYTATLQDLDAQLDSTLTNSDSLKNQLDLKLNEFFRLRNEITAILNNRKTGSDFKIAKQKISELQNRVQDFKEKNLEVENENNKLSAVLNQLGKNDARSNNSTKQPVNDNKTIAEKTSPVYPVFTVSDLRFSALVVNSDDEIETNSADKANKLAGSFTVTNYNGQLSNAEMVIVVLQPNGSVLKAGWDSGIFNTPEGKKVYSYKLNFNYMRGEAKRLLFSLKTANLAKGNYTMEVYYNGQMIGRTFKTLS